MNKEYLVRIERRFELGLVKEQQFNTLDEAIQYEKEAKKEYRQHNIIIMKRINNRSYYTSIEIE